ncbi:sugar transferase [Pseudooceanicola aestuarii]|uniref:sugar transferase n=1 Tax=Pseudooceanicola aestuarii TaxID=2697319 RepID=UPI0013D44DFE|nr:sugar transferase [Pseudooceanicola aestuarii]
MTQISTRWRSEARAAEQTCAKDALPRLARAPVPAVAARPGVVKRAADIALSLLLLPLLALVSLCLLALNPMFNPGRLLFLQIRMGHRCEPFVIYKFRTMTDVAEIRRSADDPLEVDRITRLGSLLRKTRLDELPQIINILIGQMSFIGPRPDSYDHAMVYLDKIPGYRRRHDAVPGITGLAQTEVGYVQGIAATRRKVAADVFYIRNSGSRMEMWILWRTCVTVVMGRGK